MTIRYLAGRSNYAALLFFPEHLRSAYESSGGTFRLEILLRRGHTKETGNHNFQEKSPISSRQLVSRLAGAH
jgi:hypothetical protein